MIGEALNISGYALGSVCVGLFALFALRSMLVSPMEAEPAEPTADHVHLAPAPELGRAMVTRVRATSQRGHPCVTPEPWMVRLKEAYAAGYYRTEVDRELQECFPWQTTPYPDSRR
jgi:hypothetical protein